MAKRSCGSHGKKTNLKERIVVGKGEGEGKHRFCCALRIRGEGGKKKQTRDGFSEGDLGGETLESTMI